MGCCQSANTSDPSKPVIYNKNMSDTEREARRQAAAQAAEKRAHDLSTRGVQGPMKASAAEVPSQGGMLRPGHFN
eukprot:g23244.t1